MVFNTYRNSNSFGRLAATVKHWVHGRTTVESRRFSPTPQEEIKCPGVYALLVGTDRR